MCGIFGFTTHSEQSVRVVIEGLKELEYRGYDSWGVAASLDSAITSEKQVGKIGSAISTLPDSCAILGHTRWATHGAITEANAHPHQDCQGRLAVIHNGIVENHAHIKADLAGHIFASETDTEVVAHLIEDELKSADTLVSALMSSFQYLEGLSAIAVLDAATGEMAAAKNGSPLVVGIAEDGMYLASDATVLLPYTRQLVFLEDGQAVSLSPSAVRVFEIATGTEVEPDVRSVDWVHHSSDLGSFDHYMAKEINEQPGVLRHLVESKAVEISRLTELIRESDDIYLTGCGTAHNAALAGQYLFSRLAGRRVTPVMSSEIGVMEPVITSGSLLIALSQSGETIDVLDAARLFMANGGRVVAVTNGEGSSLYRLAELSILLETGTERCVLATKTYTAKLALLTLAASAFRVEAHGAATISEAARLVESQLNDENDHHAIRQLATRISPASNIFVLGRGVNYPMAMEAALKIKEVSYIHAEGFASGELKHGVIALIEPGTPCLIFATEPGSLKATLNAAAEVKARGALTVGFSQEPHDEFDIHVPLRGQGVATLFELTSVFQLLAYHLAVVLGRDPDKPRNLAKSVTVR